MLDGENNDEKEEQTESEFQNRRESGSKNCRKFRKRFDKEHDVDKEITFMQEKKRDKNNQVSLSTSLPVCAKAPSAFLVVFN
jgi:hypothetical protein